MSWDAADEKAIPEAYTHQFTVLIDIGVCEAKPTPRHVDGLLV